MNFWVDESVDGPVVERLRQDGHAVQYVAEMSPGISDDEVLTQANQAGAILITADKDFGDLVFRQFRFTTGIVFLRLEGLSSLTKAEVVAAAINEHEAELPNAFTTIAPGLTRVRRWDKLTGNGFPNIN